MLKFHIGRTWRYASAVGVRLMLSSHGAVDGVSSLLPVV